MWVVEATICAARGVTGNSYRQATAGFAWTTKPALGGLWRISAQVIAAQWKGWICSPECLDKRLRSKAPRQALRPLHGGQSFSPCGAPIIGGVGGPGFAGGATGGVALILAGLFVGLGISAATAFDPGQFGA